MERSISIPLAGSAPAGGGLRPARSLRVALLRPSVLMPNFNMATMITPPLGLVYVAAALRGEGHRVNVVDSVGLAIEQFTQLEQGVLHGLRPEEFAEHIPPGTECIGISVQFSYEWPVCRNIIRLLRERFPDTFLFAGGEHITAMPGFCLEGGELDAVVLGEGEITACELLAAYSRDGTDRLENVPGIAFRRADGETVTTSVRKRSRNLQAIARPAWDLIPIEEYLSRGHGFGVNRGRSIPVLASRGCPYQCTFCSNPQMWTTEWLARDPGDLLDEIADLQRRYNVENFDFYDLTVIVKRQWILDFCQQILDRQMSFTWQLPSGTRSEAIDADVSRMLHRTGCRNISYAPESGSDETLRLIKKKISKKKMLASMRGAVKSGLNVKANFIFGFPHERWRHLLETMGFILHTAWVGIHDISIWIFVPYPGSELFAQLRKEGRICETDDDYFLHLAAYADITQSFSYSPYLGTRALLFARIVGLLLFYLASWLLRPWRPWKLLWNALTGRMESRSEMAIHGLISRLWRMAGASPAQH